MFLKQTQKMCQLVLRHGLVMKVKNSTLVTKQFVKERGQSVVNHDGSGHEQSMFSEVEHDRTGTLVVGRDASRAQGAYQAHSSHENLVLEKMLEQKMMENSAYRVPLVAVEFNEQHLDIARE